MGGGLWVTPAGASLHHVRICVCVWERERERVCKCLCGDPCMCVSFPVLQCSVCVCVCVLASSVVLVMLRQTVSGWVYFWVSDSVSMAADASERKALRYKQTLVSVPLSFLLFLLSPSLLLSVFVHLSVSTSASLASLSLSLSLSLSVVCRQFLSPESPVSFVHDAPVLAERAPCIDGARLTYCMRVPVNEFWTWWRPISWCITTGSRTWSRNRCTSFTPDLGMHTYTCTHTHAHTHFVAVLPFPTNLLATCLLPSLRLLS